MSSNDTTTTTFDNHLNNQPHHIHHQHHHQSIHQDSHQHHHHESPEFAGNYTFGAEALTATSLHYHHPHNPFETLHAVTGGGGEGEQQQHQAMHSEASLFDSPVSTSSGSNVNLQHSHHLLGHNGHHLHVHHDSRTDLSGVGVGGGGPPQYTSVIVEPQQAYQMAHEYVH